MAGAEKYGSTLALATEWILSQQEPTGTWPDEWFPLPFTSVLAVEFLEDRVRPLDAVDDLAATPTASGEDGGVADESIFRKQGDKWVVRYGGVTKYLKDTKGMRYVSYLLYHIDEEFTAVQLLWAVNGEGEPEPTAAEAAAGAGYDDELLTTGPPDAGDVADEQAVRQARQRLKELLEEEREADENSDPERRAIAVKERQDVEDYLRRVLGLGGRPRKGGDHHARVIDRVRKNISRALERLEEELPDLSLHLRNSIQTTPLFTYRPDPPVKWFF